MSLGALHRNLDLRVQRVLVSGTLAQSYGHSSHQTRQALCLHAKLRKIA